MAMTISGSSGVTFPDSTSMTSGTQACKAWVNFNGTGTVAIRASFNVSSITDNGTGDYTINFMTAMPDANYAVCGMAQRSADGSVSGASLKINSSTSPSTGAVRINTAAAAALDNHFDCVIVDCAAFR